MVQAERGWLYMKKEVENIEQKFFVWGLVFEKIDLESVYRNLIRRAEEFVRQNGQDFQQLCNNKLYDYFILFHYVFLIFRYGKNKLKLR